MRARQYKVQYYNDARFSSITCCTRPRPGFISFSAVMTRLKILPCWSSLARLAATHGPAYWPGNCRPYNILWFIFLVENQMLILFALAGWLGWTRARCRWRCDENGKSEMLSSTCLKFKFYFAPFKHYLQRFSHSFHVKCHGLIAAYFEGFTRSPPRACFVWYVKS